MKLNAVTLLDAVDDLALFGSLVQEASVVGELVCISQGAVRAGRAHPGAEAVPVLHRPHHPADQAISRSLVVLRQTRRQSFVLALIAVYLAFS